MGHSQGSATPWCNGAASPWGDGLGDHHLTPAQVSMPHLPPLAFLIPFPFSKRPRLAPTLARAINHPTPRLAPRAGLCTNKHPPPSIPSMLTPVASPAGRGNEVAPAKPLLEHLSGSGILREDFRASILSWSQKSQIFTKVYWGCVPFPAVLQCKADT